VTVLACVDNSRRSVIGTSYRRDSERLDGLKVQIAVGTEPRTRSDDYR
jgi:hypothetical protein